MLSVEYLNATVHQPVETLREMIAASNQIDIFLASLPFKFFEDFRPWLTQTTSRGGQLRVIALRDPVSTSPDVIEILLGYPNTSVAFAADVDPNRPDEYLFYTDSGRRLTVVTSSPDATYPGRELKAKCHAQVTHHDIGADADAQQIIDRFERQWERAVQIDSAILAAFKSESGHPSVAEGDLVRSTSDLFKSFGIGRVQKSRNGVAKIEFNPSVFMEPPYRSEIKIIKISDLQLVETPLERATRGEWEPAWRFEARMMAARLLTGNKGGQLSNARTEILPHQIFTADRVVSSAKRRFLLADEVGLGKTIEAGMIWQALEQRGIIKRTLIITPAGLTTQWQEEMKEKFNADFEIFGRDFLSTNPRVWQFKAKAIASIDRLKRPIHKRILMENRKWDLIIFDEAHRLTAVDYASGKIDKTQNYRLAEEIKTKQYSEAFLLLSATPHQGDEDHSRFKNLLLLLDDDIDFSALEGLDLFAGHGTKFTELVIRTPKKDVTDANGHKVFKGRQTHRLRCEMYKDEAAFYQAVAEYIRGGYRMLERQNDDRQRRASGFLLTTFQKLNASSTAAIRVALKTRLDRLRGQIAELPEEDPDDDAIFDARYEGEYEEECILKDDKAVMEDEIAAIEHLLALPVKRDKKLDELMRLVERIAEESPRGVEEKVLIFTEYRRTQEYLVAELEKKCGKGSAAVIHGGMKLERSEENEADIETLWAPYAREGAIKTPSTKRTSQRLFREHPRVRFLVSTEAGGEGINLQFCHVCVNYDLPWNPMRVEQRVGRVYRYGQDKVVQVYHLFNKATIEEKVESYFAERVEKAAQAIVKVTGEDPEEIKATLNGQLEVESDTKLTEIYKRAMVEGDLNKQTQKEITDAVEMAKRAYEIATQSLFRDVSSYSFDKYQRELATDLTLEDLQRFTERFMAQQRRQLQKKQPFLEFLVPDVLKPWELPERFHNATFSRALAIQRMDAEFLALGHPFVDAMLEYSGSYDFGGLTAVRRLPNAELAGRRGFLFLFVVRKQVPQRIENEYLFEFRPVFVRSDGEIDDEALSASISQMAKEDAPSAKVPCPTDCFQAAQKHLETETELWDWNDDVEFIGMSWVEFV